MNTRVDNAHRADSAIVKGPEKRNGIMFNLKSYEYTNWSNITSSTLQMFGDESWNLHLRIVGVINQQRMRPSLATGECQIPDVWDYPILASSSPSPLLLLPPSIHLESYQFIATDIVVNMVINHPL